jgi:anthranilate phosphoribosyltransferase
MKKILNYLFDHKTLTRSEAEEVLTNIAGGNYSESEIAAFITVYLMRSITVEELSGFRNALQNLCMRVNLDEFDTIDVCGTGGDGKDTFNISTLSTFVLAGAGVKVTKHGNYGVSSVCGSSNIMEYFGYTFSTDLDKLRNEIDKTGVCFLHAPLFNPAMKNVAPVRRALKVKTFFNMLGPMINPCFPRKQLVGVYSLDLARLYNYLYQQSDIQFAIIHSLDGYDEVSLTSDFKYILNGVEEIVAPEAFGYKRNEMTALYGGSNVQESAGIFMNVLQNKGSDAQMNVVVANTQMALMCYYADKTPEDCKAMAEYSLKSGKAYKAFDNLITLQS